MSTATGPAIHSPKSARRVVLTPNRQVLERLLAETLAGLSANEVRAAPAVHTLSNWVEDTVVRMRQLAGESVPLSVDSVSELLGWMRLFTEDQAGRSHALGAARQARAADRLLRQWRLEGESGWLEPGFYRLRQMMLRRHEAENRYHAEDWFGDFAARLDAGDPVPPELPDEIALRGFVEFTVAERRLLESLEARGVRLDEGPGGNQPGDIRVLESAHPEDEWHAAANWARSLVDAGATSVCIVVPPSLTRSASEWRSFQRVLSLGIESRGPASPGSDQPGTLYIPAARTLRRVPVVEDAMGLLRLATTGAAQPVEFPDLSHWLLSPHWGPPGSDRLSRTRLELRLREREVFSLARDALIRFIRDEGFEGELGGLVDRLGGIPAPASPDQAGRWCHAVLGHWGWPGQAEAGSAVTSFLGVLERLDRLSCQSLDEALQALEVMLEQTALPSGGGALSPVQVLDPETAAAGRFDATWVCHLDDSAWPPAMPVNPLLPGEVQRDIPRMNPEGHFDYYRRLTAMLCASAPEVRLSWSRDAGQGPRGPSTLIEDWPQECTTKTPAPYVSGTVETIADDAGLALPPDDVVDLPGGTEFFRLQAACPLAAYTRFRLDGHFPAPPGRFASARFRGELLHLALRALYARGQEGHGRDERNLPVQADIGPAVAEALAITRARQKLGQTGYEAERGRLHRALGEWLDLDRSRQGFRVESLEIPQALSLGRARLNLRIDRIDRLDDGRLFLIDYKSGGSNSNRALKWMRPRLQEPQLPVYAVMLEEALDLEVGGLSLAIVKPNECAFDGISDDERSAARGIRVAGQGRVKKQVPDWQRARAHWREQSLVLAEEILTARADNRVYDADIASYSGLELVLRHSEAGETAEEGHDDD